jgi:glycine betaine/proline transport system substrate-binding protein
VRRPSRFRLVLAATLGLALLASACGDGDGDAGGTDDGTDTADDEASDDGDDGEAADADGGMELVLFDGQWESLWILNEIFTVVAEDGHGHTVDAPTTSTAVMQESMPDGEMHVATEFWCMNIPDWCDEQLLPDDSPVEYTGVVFEDAVQGIFVPRYVIEGDEEEGIEPLAPDLQSVEDLEGLGEVFEDPESPGDGALYGGIDGWESTEIQRLKLSAYGLDDEYNFISAGSGSAYDAAIVSAIESGEPILFYYWTPAWIPGVYDLVQLEEPEWNEDCQAATDEALADEIDPGEAGEELGCAQPSGEVGIGGWAGLEDEAPEVLELLRAMDGFGVDTMNDLTAYMELEGVEPNEVAVHFYEEYEDIWRDWVDGEVEERLEEGLRERGADV